MENTLNSKTTENNLWAKLKDFGISLITILGAIGGITTIVCVLMKAFGKTLFPSIFNF